jgi:Nop14-like family
LLKEYDEKGRTGGIVDRRFGENDPMMSLEERMLERFTKERQRASKGIAFNLEDDDDLTHYGQSLSKLDDFDNVGLRIDSDEEETSGTYARSIYYWPALSNFPSRTAWARDSEQNPFRRIWRRGGGGGGGRGGF